MQVTINWYTTLHSLDIWKVGECGSGDVMSRASASKYICLAHSVWFLCTFWRMTPLELASQMGLHLYVKQFASVEFST